jgi:hypothetical protein
MFLAHEETGQRKKYFAAAIKTNHLAISAAARDLLRKSLDCTINGPRRQGFYEERLRKRRRKGNKKVLGRPTHFSHLVWRKTREAKKRGRND